MHSAYETWKSLSLLFEPTKGKSKDGMKFENSQENKNIWIQDELENSVLYDLYFILSKRQMKIGSIGFFEVNKSLINVLMTA